MTSIHLYERAIQLTAEKKPFVFAAVIDAVGSTPQKAGANALIEPNGTIWGTLGGGCLEAESRQRALRALDEDQPDVFDLKLDEVTGWDDGLICGGMVRIFVNPAARLHAGVYGEALAARDRQESGLLATVIAHPNHPMGSVFFTREEDLASASPSANGLYAGREIEALARLHRETPGIFPSDERSEAEPEKTELYLEPVVSPPKLIIAGGGHIGQAVCRLAAGLGFEVTVIDDRPAFASADCHPAAARTICGDIPKELASLPVGPHTYILVVTRGHRHDGTVLASSIQSGARYIGMIGSRRKSLLIRKSLFEQGIATREQIERVVSPIGLDIGAESVEEIALSIAAQLVAVRRKGKLDAPAKDYHPSVLKA